MADQIAGPHQARFGIGCGVVFVIRHREARKLDGLGDAVLVDVLNGRETLPDNDLSPLYMIGREKRVGRPARRRHRVAGGVHHEILGCVAGAGAPDIADVVDQRGQYGMGPIAGCDDPLDAPAAQDVLDAERDEHGVLDIVIERVAAGDALDDEPGRLIQSGGQVRLLVAIASAVGLRQVPTQCISQKARGVQHIPLLRGRLGRRSMPG